MIEKTGAVHLVKFYGGDGRKYQEARSVKYLVLPKCETNYKKVRPNTNLI